MMLDGLFTCSWPRREVRIWGGRRPSTDGRLGDCANIRWRGESHVRELNWCLGGVGGNGRERGINQLFRNVGDVGFDLLHGGVVFE